MRHYVIINHQSGQFVGLSPSAAEGLVRAWFEAAGLSASLVTVAADDLPAAIDLAARTPPDVVIVVAGGDGTVALAAERLRTSEKVLGLIPLGTMNLLAKDLRIPLQPEAAVRALGDAQVRAVDAGELNGRLFLHSSVLGLYAWLAKVRERQRGRPLPLKWATLAMAVVRALRAYKVIHVGLTGEGGRRTLHVPMLCVTNNALRQAPLLLGERERLDGGRLAVYAPTHRTPFGFVLFVLRLLFGNWGSDPRLETLETRRLAVVSRRRRLSVANDGEVVEVRPPLRYRSVPKALRILAPRTLDPTASGAGNETGPDAFSSRTAT